MGRGFLLLLLSGCAPHPAAPPSDTASPALHITLTTSPAKPRPLDQTTFTISLTDAQRARAAGATVKVALAMPSMTMPENIVTCQPSANGYRGLGRFTMAGDWTATVTANEGKETARKTFAFQVH